MTSRVFLNNNIREFYDRLLWDYSLYSKILWKYVFLPGTSGSPNYAIHYGFYDEKHEGSSDAAENMNKILAAKVHASSDTKILDAGCGIGGSAIWLAKQFGAYVTGVTLSNQQSIVARQLAKEAKVSHLTTFLACDYMETGFLDASFDIVWAIESVCYAENKMDFVLEARRLLKPGGQIVIADTFFTRDTLSEDEKFEVKTWLKRYAVANLETPHNFHALLQNGGFKKIVCENVTKNITPHARRVYLWASFTYYVGKVLAWCNVKSEKRRNDTTRIAGIRQYKTLKKGLWGYNIFSAIK